MKSDLHEIYLNLGSNIQPEINLVKAIQLLYEYGDVIKISSAWESKAVGLDGPNYLNACVLFRTDCNQANLKEKIIRPTEAKLGRERSEDKYTPRTIDIDVIIFDDAPYHHTSWEFAFVVIPLAEIYPEYQNPLTFESVAQTATRLRKDAWIEKRPEVLRRFSGNSFEGQN